MKSIKQTSPIQVQTSKRVVLKLGHLEDNGIPVTLQVGNTGHLPIVECDGWLPPVDPLLIALKRWQLNYRQLYRNGVRLEAPLAQITNISYAEALWCCHQAEDHLANQINGWFNAPLFRPLKETLLSMLDPSEPIQMCLQTDHPQIRTLPLHLWDWFERYPKAALVMSDRTYYQPPTQVAPAHPVRILAVLGDSQGIDVERDRRLLSTLPEVALTYLVEPSRSQLNEALWAQPWDILFFAGHSDRPDEQQRLRLNPQEALSLSELKFGLKRATHSGLKLAIFNTCDGLQLVCDLKEERALPPIIAMRFPVPDPVAQFFLQYFLSAFSAGAPLFMAVREATERLQGLESQFPFASWLPVLWQNPVAPPLTWGSLMA